MISVITPLHEPGNRYISETSDCLRRAYNTWGMSHELEWLILENHGGKVPDEIKALPSVRVVRQADNGPEVQGIGRLKGILCGMAKGEWIVELDADDLLAPEALERIAWHFERGYDFIYSDFCEFQDETWAATSEYYPYAPVFGWSHYPVQFQGHELLAMRAPPVTAHNLRFVDWVPNHVRAWKKETYQRLGGHDPRYELADDHDLAVRFFLAGAQFGYIPECLYFYRVHNANTVKTANPAIRAATNQIYNANVWKLAERWCEARGLMKVDLCGGMDSPPGYLTLDRSNGAAVRCNLDRAWPLKANSVGVLRAQDALEHLRDPVQTMNEAYRVLAPGGWFMINVPSTNGMGAFCDPGHVSFWNELSFRYYTDPRFSKYVPAFKGKFQVSRVIEHCPWDPRVPYVEAHLLAYKDGFRPMGEVLW